MGHYIKTTINEYLERITNVLYHFTPIDSLRYGTILTDGLIFRPSDLRIDKHDFFISTTRNKDFKWLGNVRICLDKEKINQKYTIKPVAFFKNKKIKDQYEERIYSSEMGYLDTAYFKHIDIIIESYAPKEFYENVLKEIDNPKNIKINLIQK